jgi:hypothetical protein
MGFEEMAGLGTARSEGDADAVEVGEWEGPLGTLAAAVPGSEGV